MEAYTGNYNDVTANIISLAQNKERFILAVDGRCCSGKTTLANMLAQKMPATVFSTDDYYLPFESRTPKTRATPAGHMDLKRFREEVLLPASAGMRVNYRPFNCKTGRFEKEQKITPKHFIIIEGSYSQHPDLAGSYGYKLFLTVTAQKQQRRILLRGGKESLAAFTRIWIPAEERYFKKYRIREKSDCVLDTSLNW